MAEFALIRAGALAALVAALAPSARADVAEAVEGVILPAYDQLAETSSALAEAATADCAPDSLRAPFNATWDAWARIDFLRLGPVETDGRALAIHFWPDKKSSGLRAQQGLIDGAPAVITDPKAFADLSVALRGLAGLERLIYPSPITGDAALLCDLRVATARDLARMAHEIRDEWGSYAPRLLAPGEGGNTEFLDVQEARQALFTQIMTGLSSLADTRLGRPMGSFDRPRPERAEARASGRSLRNVTASLEGLRATALALMPAASQTDAAFTRALHLAGALDDPIFEGVADPQTRLKVEILQTAIRTARGAVETEIGGALGLSVGFNAKDGD